MEIELVPDPGAGDAVQRAVVAALERLGAVEGSGAGAMSSWQAAGLHDAVTDEIGSPLRVARPQHPRRGARVVKS